MPGEYWQLHTEDFSIDGKVSRFAINGVVRGASSRTEVLALVMSAHPIILDNCVRKGVSKADRLGGGVWMTTLDYSSMDPLQALAPGGGGTGGVSGSPSAPPSGDGLDDAYSFDFNAQTTHITQSIQTKYAFAPGEVSGGATGLSITATAPVGKYVNPGPGGYAPVAGDLGKRIHVDSAVGFIGGEYTITAVNVGGSEWTLDVAAGTTVGAVSGPWYFIGSAPNFKKAIGVSDDRVEGCDIFTPSFTWQRTSPIETVSRDYMRTVRDLIGTTNAASFYGSAIGEVLFVGCSGQGGQGKRWNVTFKFAENENRTSVDVGGIILPKVGGWEHVWIRYKRQVSNFGLGAVVANSILQVPAYAYVEQVYYPGDFSALNIGA